MPVARSAVEAVFREEHGRIVAVLARRTRDLSLAEDAVQTAFAAALGSWDEIPERPAAWIVAVAKNAALSALRHGALVDAKHAELARQLAEAPDSFDLEDERLRLLFVCCHPAIDPRAQIALSLHTLLGLDVAAIARLFFTTEATMAQRLVRAKRKIQVAGIPFEIPHAERLEARLGAVLACVYLLFTEGYASAGGAHPVRPEVAAEAIRLGRLVCLLCPTHAEARGLLALMLFHAARSAARTDASGAPVPLDEQDRSLWDRRVIDEAARELDYALERGQPGPYQTQAAIAALHATAVSSVVTDWPQIAGLYRELLRVAPSPSAALSFAFAEGMASSPHEGLRVLDELERSGDLNGTHRVAATRAELLRRAGDVAGARGSYASALAEARSARERLFLERRVASL